MPIGVLIDSSAILIGGIIGAIAGNKIPEKISNSLTGIFGLSAITMGITLIIQMDALTAVVMSLIVGTLLGECLNLENSLIRGLSFCASKLPGKDLSKEQMDNLISMIILFCFSGTGIFGSINSGISGDHTILIAKSIMDFFTAIIFGAITGYLVSAIAIPHIILNMFLYFFGSLLFPLLTDSMVQDFKAVGGIITFAVGLKISKVRHYQVLNMVPALILVFLFSKLWNLLPF
ncbi:MAG: DUF554 domain-containing protein [Lachnospiraceae bacterium]|nr:DUF554 domain-containing protein [Lachnospiraceae bacterium]